MMPPSSVCTHRAHRASGIERMDMVLGTLKGEDEADPYLHLNMAAWVLTVYIICASYFC